MKTAAKAIIYGLIIVLLTAPFYLMYDHVTFRRVSPGIEESADDELAPLTSHTTRLSADNPTELSLKAVQMRYPKANSVPMLVIAPSEDPLAALYALRLTAPPVGAGLVLLPRGEAPPEGLLEQMKHMAPRGMGPQTKQVVVVGEFAPQVRSRLAETFRIRCLDRSGPPLAVSVDELVSDINPEVNGERVLLISSEDPRYALPLATWLSRTADPVFPIDSDGPSDEVTARLQILQQQLGDKTLNIYLAAPLRLASTGVLEDLGKIGQVTRVAGSTPEQQSLTIARYYDRGTHFGWFSENTPHRDQVYLLANPDYPGYLLSCAQIFAENWSGPTILTEADALCPSVETYLWSIRPSWTTNTPGGPFSHAWIAGGEESVGWPIQARIDYINTPGPYLTQTPRGASGLEALLILWLIASWLSGVWTWCHSVMRRQQTDQLTRLAWVLAVLITGPLGLLGYYLSYRAERPRVAKQHMNRSPISSAAAGAVAVTAMTSAVMIITRLAILANGATLRMTTGSVFWLGNPGVWSLLVGYAVAAVIVVLVIDPAISGNSYRQAVGTRWRVTLSMVTSAALLFSLGVWLLEYLYLTWPPEVGRTAWWGAASTGAALALICTYPLSYYWALVRPQYDKF